MAPLDQYLMTDRNSEISLARSAAPSSVSEGAEVMVLERTIYNRSAGPKWFCLPCRAIMGRCHTRSGLLECQDPVSRLF